MLQQVAYNYLRRFEGNPTQTDFHGEFFVTDDAFADRLGMALQHRAKDDAAPLKFLCLNFGTWTKWGAHEIIQFLEQTTTLEELDLTHVMSPEETTMTSSRTLASIVDAVAANQHSSLKEIFLHKVKLDGKSLDAFCRLLAHASSIQTLKIQEGFTFRSDLELEKMGKAFQAIESIQEIGFSGVPSASLEAIVLHLGNNCPSSLQCLSFTGGDRQQLDLDLTGLDTLLKSPTCQLKEINLISLSLSQESTEALSNGLIGNTSVQKICSRKCSFHEPTLERLLQETTHLQSINLDFELVQDQAAVINALQDNASITSCELRNLVGPCGEALQTVLSRNRSLRKLVLRLSNNTSLSPLDNETVRQLAQGLRVNPVLQSLSLEGVKLEDETVLSLAQALCPPDNNSEGETETVFSPLDILVSIHETSVHHFFEPLRHPKCRLRYLSLIIENFQPIIDTTTDGDIPQPSSFGLAGLLEALEENTSVECLYLKPKGLDFPNLFTLHQEGWQRLSKLLAQSLPATTALKRLDLDFGWHAPGGDNSRHANRKCLASVRADILSGLSQNKSLQHIQFNCSMYDLRTLQDIGTCFT